MACTDITSTLGPTPLCLLLDLYIVFCALKPALDVSAPAPPHPSVVVSVILGAAFFPGMLLFFGATGVTTPLFLWEFFLFLTW